MSLDCPGLHINNPGWKNISELLSHPLYDLITNYFDLELKVEGEERWMICINNCVPIFDENPVLLMILWLPPYHGYGEPKSRFLFLFSAFRFYKCIFIV